MRRILTLALPLCLATAAPAWAQDRTILVLDASGSMWGQIDGTAKIDIARDVVRDLLGVLPEEQQLGLTVYGHRRKGDCADIETLVAPGAGTREAIGAALGGVTPRGKTPLSDAVVAAAEALRYTEDKATVILVSDGRETCEADPCDVGRRLEETGVDFTAHVVGFDVSGDADALRELQCLAEETGGRFLTAASATELGQALQEVAETPAAFPVTFQATLGEGGPVITEGLVWEIGPAEEAGSEIVQQAGFARDLAPGDYAVSVLRPADEASASAVVAIDAAQTLTLVLPDLLPQATLDAPAEAPMGDTVAVDWTGPDGKSDYIAVSRPDDARGYINYVYTSKGSPGQLLMPAEAGQFELRYYDNRGRILATRAITVTPVEATLDAPETAVAGSTVKVDWTGPDERSDYLSVALPNDQKRYVNYVYTAKGSPGELVMPPDPGTYEIRYVMAQDTTVIARRIIEVTPATATLQAAEDAVAGAQLDVEWTGPDYRADYISISKPGESGYETYTYTAKGNPLQIKVPLDEGQYEIRYVMSQDTRVIARKPLNVVAVGAELIAPETARAGSSIVVDWDGPGYQGDYVSVARPEDPRYEGYTYTRKGSPLLIKMPHQPGTYELRYIATGDGDRVLVRKPITLEDVTATITADDAAPAGGRLAIAWEGPDFKTDTIQLVKDGEDRARVSLRTLEDSPMVMDLPEAPGMYELRYVIDNKRVIARKPVELTYGE